MSVTRGSGRGDNRNGGVRGDPPDVDEWGVSPQEMASNDPPVEEGVPVEWDDAEVDTSSG